jgi:hypothetical protein
VAASEAAAAASATANREETADAIAAANNAPPDEDEDDLYADLVAPRVISILTNPFSGIIDVRTKAGAYTFKLASQLPSGCKRLDPGY